MKLVNRLPFILFNPIFLNFSIPYTVTYLVSDSEEVVVNYFGGGGVDAGGDGEVAASFYSIIICI